MSNLAFICLGSNVEKERNLPAAVRLLARLTRVVAVSSAYETEAAGGQDRPAFFNAAVAVETDLSAEALRRQVLAAVERRLGRKRTADRNAPRTIDADLILFNEEHFALDATHAIPDPDLLRFAHVAVPVAEIAPDLVHPVTGERLSEIAARLVTGLTLQGQTIRKRSDVVLSAEN
jgi:2-amino-4-hydroxy-6-hydroxymethyldihydropteridine diphosphokinase